VNVLDVNEKTWTQMPPMNSARVSHKAFSMGNKIYVIGGDYGMTSEIFDVNTGKWSFISSYSKLINNSIYSFSGGMISN